MKKILYAQLLLALLFCSNAFAQDGQPITSYEMQGKIVRLTQKIEGLEESNSQLFGALAEQNKILQDLKSRLITGEKREKNIKQSIRTAMGKMNELEQGNLAIKQSIEVQNGHLQIFEGGIKKDITLLQENYTALIDKMVMLKDLSENNLREIQNNVISVRGIHDKLSLIQKSTTDNFHKTENRNENNFRLVSQDIDRWAYYSLIGMFLLMLVNIVLFIVVRRKFNNSINTVNKSIDETIDIMKGEALSLDTKLAELLEASISAKGETGTDSITHKEIDHTLPFKVGEEIHRMRKRIAHMPEDTTGLGALKNSLIRLEDEFNAHDYQIVNLMGVDFVDGLTVDARFVPADNLKSGEEVIIKVIKPQINYKGVLIKPGQVEVGVGGDNNEENKD